MSAWWLIPAFLAGAGFVVLCMFAIYVSSQR